MSPKSANKKFESNDEILSLLNDRNKEIKKRFGVKELGIFGSYAIGKQKRKSDLDILVVFLEGEETFDNFMDLKYYLEEILGIKIDLVTKDALRKEMKENILAETVYV